MYPSKVNFLLATNYLHGIHNQNSDFFFSVTYSNFVSKFANETMDEHIPIQHLLHIWNSNIQLRIGWSRYENIGSFKKIPQEWTFTNLLGLFVLVNDLLTNIRITLISKSYIVLKGWYLGILHKSSTRENSVLKTFLFYNLGF